MVYVRIKGLIRILFAALLLFGTQVFASEEAAPAEHQESEKFNAGKFIIDHVTDKYEWHITGSHEHPVSVPLPVILYSSQTGLDVFMSGKLEHGAIHNGYRINHDG